jgi:hypothetical protein
MDWSGLDEANGTNESNGTNYVGMVSSGEDLGTNGAASTPDTMPPANEAQNEGESERLMQLRPGQYLSYGKGMNKALSRRPVAQHNGMPVYRTAPGQYVVAKPAGRRTPRLRKTVPGIPAREVMHGLGDDKEGGGGGVWGGIGSFLSEMDLPGTINAIGNWATAEGRREAELERLRLQQEEAAAQRELEAAQSEQEYQQALQRQQQLHEQSLERIRQETQANIEAMRAQASQPIVSGGLPGWGIALLAVGGLGLLGLLGVAIFKKDKDEVA